MEGSEFYFWHRIDVIEEDALNEKSFIQVLRILIAKADKEIEELEGNLLVLETQLEWAEQNKYEEWYDLCCEGLREKIHSLQLSICSLMKEKVQNELDNSVQTQTHEEPLKKIHEIIKVLLENGCQDKYEQPADIVVKSFAEDALRHANRQSNEKQHGNVNSSAINTEEVNDTNVSPRGKSIKLNSPLKTKRMSPNQPEAVKIQVASFNATDNTVTPNPSLKLQGQTKKDIAQLEKQEVQESMIGATDKISLNSSSGLQGPRTKHIIKSNKVTAEEPSSNSSLNSKRRVAKMPMNKIQLDTMGVQNPGVDELTDNNIISMNGEEAQNPKQRAAKKPKNKIRADPMGVQNPGLAELMDSNINSNSSLNSKGRKRRTDKMEVQEFSFVCFNNNNRESSLSNRNRTKKIVQPDFDGVQPNHTPTYRHISINSIFESIQLDGMKVKELQGETTESTSEDDLQLSIDYSHKYNYLKALKLNELKFYAKSLGIRGYSKMTKARLIEELLPEKEG